MYPIIEPRTTSVSLSSPKPLTPADAELDTGTSLGRRNENPPFDNIPPRVVGLELPEPFQLGGNNTPQSSIKQVGPVVSQMPGQTVPVQPPGDDYPAQFLAIPQTVFDATPSSRRIHEPEEPNEPASDQGPSEPDEQSFRIVVPKHVEPYIATAGTTPGRGNPYGPTGRISPRTVLGNDANPLLGEPMPPATSVVKQKQNPVSESRQ